MTLNFSRLVVQSENAILIFRHFGDTSPFQFLAPKLSTNFIDQLWNFSRGWGQFPTLHRSACGFFQYKLIPALIFLFIVPSSGAQYEKALNYVYHCIYCTKSMGECFNIYYDEWLVSTETLAEHNSFRAQKFSKLVAMAFQ